MIINPFYVYFTGLIYQRKVIVDIVNFQSMLRGSLFTTAWRVLRLRMEETASRYGG
jgi:hypothetical protein